MNTFLQRVTLLPGCCPRFYYLMSTKRKVKPGHPQSWALAALTKEQKRTPQIQLSIVGVTSKQESLAAFQTLPSASQLQPLIPPWPGAASARPSSAESLQLPSGWITGFFPMQI